MTPSVYTVQPGPHAQREFLGLLIQAIPGDVIELAAGKFDFDMDLELSTANITIRGQGMDKTILSFKNQHMGSKGIEATGDNFVIQDLAVEDTRGNAIKVVGAKNVTFRHVRTEWTGEPKTSNGAYGVYPVQCENVLIDGCIVRGAADAGVYVGQSRRIIVKNCNVHENVAGIEIENSFDADVFDNYATNNSGGILVFDLPGLDLHNGGRVRVFHNQVPKNNHANFGAPGSSVSNVAPGTGMLLLAMDNVEIFDNQITDNNTAGLQIISYILTGNPINDPKYDPYPEHAYIHDNHISGGGKHPGGRYGKCWRVSWAIRFPKSFTTACSIPNTLKDGKLPPEMRIRFERNGDVRLCQHPFRSVESGEDRRGQNRRRPQHRRLHGQLSRAWRRSISRRTAPPIRPATRRPDLPVGPAKSFRNTVSSKGTAARRSRSTALIPTTSTRPSSPTTRRSTASSACRRGCKVDYREDDVFDFPVGTQIVKTFAMPHDMTDASKGEELLETRIIEHKPAGWYGYSYVWNKEQTEATLALGGGTVDVSWKHSDGSLRTNNYIVPHANQCKSCHMATEKTFLPLGPKARNLNKEFAYHGGKENQLTHWTQNRGARGSAESDKAPRAAKFDDPTTGSVEQRARVWLDVNCAHCHNPHGPARTTGLDLQLSQDNPAKIGVFKSPVAAGHGSGENRFDIVPGKPEESIVRLPARIDRTGRDDARTPPPPRSRRSGEPDPRMDRPDESARQASQHKVTGAITHRKSRRSVRVLPR